MHTINATEVLFGIKINGVELTVDYSKMHPSWVTAHLRKAAQRYLNDKYSGEESATKLELIMADLADINSGKAMPTVERKAPQASKADPVRKLARDLATTFLTTELTAKLGKDMAVWARNEKLAKLFRFTDRGAARFEMAAVDEWMAGYTKTDFMAKAKETLASSDVDVSLEDLGL